MDILRRFNGDIHTKEALIEYVLGVFDQKALEALYAKKDVSAYPIAREMIIEAFEQLATDYAITTDKDGQTNKAK